jgi:hypothetical protein
MMRRRFADRDLDALRRADCAQLAPHLGLTPAPRERGKWSCPSCGSRDGLHCYPSTRGAHCYACGASLDALALTQAALGLTWPDAVRELASLLGYALDATAGAPPSTPSRASTPSTRAAASTPSTRITRRPPLSLTSPSTTPAPSWAADWSERYTICLDGGADDLTAARLATEQMARDVRAMFGELGELLDALDGALHPDLLGWAAARALTPELLASLGWRAVSGQVWAAAVGALRDRWGAPLVEAAGLIREGRPWPHSSSERPVVAIPYPDAAGELATVRLRVRGADGAWSKPLALPHPDRDGWLPSTAPATWYRPCAPYLLAHALATLTATAPPDAPLYLVEGESSAAAMWGVGRPAIGLAGAHGWADGWARYLPSDRPLVYYRDNDAAGLQAWRRVARDASRLWGVATARERLTVCKSAHHGDAGDLHRAGLLGAALTEYERGLVCLHHTNPLNTNRKET